MHDVTAVDAEKLARDRALLAKELPDLLARDALRKEAQGEGTLSGELRRMIHSSPLPVAEIASIARITPLMLDEFLTGERTLRSDVLDRLAATLGVHLQPRP